VTVRKSDGRFGYGAAGWGRSDEGQLNQVRHRSV
jgi:hypothetical protein